VSNSRAFQRARELYDLKGPDGKRAHTVAEIGKMLGVSRQTIYRSLAPEAAS
jgi:DNA-binding phage protein